MNGTATYLGDVILNGYKKAFNYNGRDSRARYISFIIFQHLWFILYLALIAAKNYEISFIALAIFALPMLASNIRRLHDAGYSAALCLIWLFMPYLIIIFAAFPKTRAGKNAQ